MIYYHCIVGSRAYGLETEESDVDELYVSDDGTKSSLHHGRHIIAYSPDAFCGQVPIPTANELAYKVTWMFPAQVLTQTPLYALVAQVREDVIRAARPDIYRAYMKKADALAYRLRQLYPAFPKRVAYSCLFYDMIASYAEGASFGSAHRPDENLRQWLLAVRRQEIDVTEIEEKNAQLRKKAEDAAGFYAVEADTRYLQEIGAQMQTLLHTAI